jgi:hypothetical protein
MCAIIHTGVNAQHYALFKPIAVSNLALTRKLTVQALSPDKKAIHDIYNTASPELSLEIPMAEGNTVTLVLHKFQVLTNSFQVVNEKDEPLAYDPGVHYTGYIQGQPQSYATVSFFNNSFNAIFSNNDGNYNLAQYKDDPDLYVLFNDRELEYVPTNMQCAVKDRPYTAEELTPAMDTRQAKVIKIYVETDYDIYQAMGNSEQNVSNYMIAMYAQSFAIYAKEGITQKLNKLKIWTQASSYDASGQSDGYLASFQAKTGKLDGDIAALLTTQEINGGIAASFVGVCYPEPDSLKYVTSVELKFEQIPTFSWDVDVVTHECGHLLGSRHTHACVWNGNKTQIDDCANKNITDNGGSVNDTEGSACYDINNPILPSNGGTIMSYCDFIQGVGVNFSLGFGSQPGDVVRNKTASQGSCLETTSGGGLVVNPTSLNFPVDGGEKQITITTDGDWALAADPNYPPYFITPSPTSGTGNSTVSIKATKNNFPFVNGTKLYVANKDSYVEVQITQDAVPNKAMFYPDTTMLSPWEGGFGNATVLANIDWKLVLTEADKKWLTVTPASGNGNADLNIEIKKNPYPLNRYARVKMVYNNGLDSTYLRISQPCENSEYINVPAEIVTYKKGAKYAFQVLSDMTWEVTQKPAWIESMNPTKGKGNAVIEFTPADNTSGNDRYFNLVVRGVKTNGDSVVKTIKLTQLSAYGSVADVSVYPTINDGTFNIEINNAAELNYSVYSALGAEVYRSAKIFSDGATYSNTLHLDAAPGIYTVVISTNGKVHTQKIVIK